VWLGGSGIIRQSLNDERLAPVHVRHRALRRGRFGGAERLARTHCGATRGPRAQCPRADVLRSQLCHVGTTNLRRARPWRAVSRFNDIASVEGACPAMGCQVVEQHPSRCAMARTGMGSRAGPSGARHS
jgi:hypothetical protein